MVTIFWDMKGPINIVVAETDLISYKPMTICQTPKFLVESSEFEPYKVSYKNVPH